MPGPAPKPADARARRNKTPVSMRLPAAGRTEPAPPWPVGYTPTQAIADIWDELWGPPQAVAWAHMSLVRVVARYAVMLLDHDPRTAAELRQLEDRLGLNPLAMRRLEWVIAADEVGEKRDDKKAAKAADSRSRYSGLRAVGGTDAPAAP